MLEKTCFFISPFGPRNSERRKDSDFLMNVLLTPALAVTGFSEEGVIRSDRESTPYITAEMFRQLDEADLCIADLTGLNPNVFLELGYRRKVGKPLIAIAKEGEELPFDTRDYRVIRYPAPDTLREQPIEWENTRSELNRQIKQSLSSISDNRLKDQEDKERILRLLKHDDFLEQIVSLSSNTENASILEMPSWLQAMNEKLDRILDMLQNSKE